MQQQRQQQHQFINPLPKCMYTYRKYITFRIFFFHFRIVPIDFIISIGFDILFPCFALLFQNTFFPFLVVSFSLRKNRILHFGFPEFIDAKFARIHEFVRHIP